ncbi:hypothetical protein KFL_002480120 [Klebsormidium nitens]|uniref:Chromatin target of PRMT1 protein C-terminal domain-containing protein n=1 Tax=Klebsormidium nitens TaxID=105231 RepID=A0A1Y1I411_KLENI|nr:hypothetical protein KFL_002480120 [Klebsormidium nitens]|eukprot:GAQ85674.1 hypothetical protein KFL_002480120 [Klebsormidium nitens]
MVGRGRGGRGGGKAAAIGDGRSGRNAAKGGVQKQSWKGGQGKKSDRGGGKRGRGRGGKKGQTVTKESLDADLDKWRLGDANSAKKMLDDDLDTYFSKKETAPEEKPAETSAPVVTEPPPADLPDSKAMES